MDLLVMHSKTGKNKREGETEGGNSKFNRWSSSQEYLDHLN
jgi:hypothetical protein